MRNGKTIGVKFELNSEVGRISMIREFCAGPIHHDLVLGMPGVPAMAHSSPPHEAINASVRGIAEKVYFAPVFASCTAIGVKAASRGKKNWEADALQDTKGIFMHFVPSVLMVSRRQPFKGVRSSLTPEGHSK